MGFFVVESSDVKVIERILRGESEVFAVLIKRYQIPIINYMYRMMGDYETAVDLSQEVFLKVYLSLDKYDKEYKFSTWLYKIASNQTIDYLRKKKLNVVSIDHVPDSEEEGRPFEIPSNNPGPEELFFSKDLQERIERVLETLPEEHRELLVLRHVNGLSYNEIAEVTNLPLGTVKNRIFRARQQLKKRVFPEQRSHEEE
jgi:RNA polymerase sigma-70 factor (ECF subfamily)